HLVNAVLDHRQRHPRVELEDVGRDSRRDLDDLSEPASAVLDHVETDELEDVKLTRCRRSERLTWHLERSAPRYGPVELHDGTATRVPRCGHPRRLAADVELRADREPFGFLACALDDERAVQAMRPAHTADDNALAQGEKASSAASGVGHVRRFSSAKSLAPG